MKHIKLFEQFIKEAKVDAQGFSDEFASLIFDIEEDRGEEISSDAIASLLTIVWDEVVEQNNFDEMIGSLALAFRKANVAMDDSFKTGYARTAAQDFGQNMYDSTGFSWSGTMECFNELFPMANIKGAQIKKLEKMLNGWFTNESVVNEAKLSPKDKKKLQAFAEEVADEIYDEYADDFDRKSSGLDADDFTAEEMFNYLLDHIEFNEMTVDELMDEWDWRSMRSELGLA